MAPALWIAALATALAGVQATEFLGAQRQGESVAKEVVREMLFSASPGSENTERVASLVEQLRPAFAALPKNELGQLEPSTVRYILHRHFVQKFGWYVKGLDPEGEGWNASAVTAPSGDVRKGMAPAYMQMLFAARAQSSGLDLSGLAVFAATLEDLIFQDALGGLSDTYAKLGLSTSGAVEDIKFELAVRAYLSVLITGDYGKFDSQADFASLEAQARSFYPEYDDIIKWFRNLYLSRNLLVLSEGVTFERAGDFLRELLRHFASQPQGECRTLKKQMVQMERPGTGRVSLSDFYKNQKLQMHESVAYLRNLGALESEASDPRVVIPNYISSPSRCMPFSSYYSICCPDECDGLMVSLERDIGQPSAPAARIAELASSLPSDTVVAPRQLSSQLLGRLSEIASLHGGLVPLHGRLFLQWMHHAYPRECSYPHAAGTTAPVTQDQWMRMHPGIEDSMVTPEERKQCIDTKPSIRPMEAQDIPWSVVEELVAVHKPGPGHAGEAIRIAVCLVALVFFAVRVLRVPCGLAKLGRRQAKEARHPMRDMLSI